jgi:hypothetical protein
MAENLAFAGDHHEAKCQNNRCQNRRMLPKYEMSGHIAKHRFMPNYMVWQQHGEVEAATPAELDESDDEDRMDDMIADIGMEYEIGSRDQQPPPKVQNGTNLTILWVVTRLIGMNSKYNFSNQRYNDNVKLIIDVIVVKHNMTKDLYQSKKIVVGPGMNYEKTDVCERNFMLF